MAAAGVSSGVGTDGCADGRPGETVGVRAGVRVCMVLGAPLRQRLIAAQQSVQAQDGAEAAKTF